MTLTRESLGRDPLIAGPEWLLRMENGDQHWGFQERLLGWRGDFSETNLTTLGSLQIYRKVAETGQKLLAHTQLPCRECDDNSSASLTTHQPTFSVIN